MLLVEATDGDGLSPNSAHCKHNLHHQATIEMCAVPIGLNKSRQKNEWPSRFSYSAWNSCACGIMTLARRVLDISWFRHAFISPEAGIEAGSGGEWIALETSSRSKLEREWSGDRKQRWLLFPFPKTFVSVTPFTRFLMLAPTKQRMSSAVCFPQFLMFFFLVSLCLWVESCIQLRLCIHRQTCAYTFKSFGNICFMSIHQFSYTQSHHSATHTHTHAPNRRAPHGHVHRPHQYNQYCTK